MLNNKTRALRKTETAVKYDRNAHSGFRNTCPNWVKRKKCDVNERNENKNRRKRGRSVERGALSHGAGGEVISLKYVYIL